MELFRPHSEKYTAATRMHQNNFCKACYADSSRFKSSRCHRYSRLHWPEKRETNMKKNEKSANLISHHDAQSIRLSVWNNDAQHCTTMNNFKSMNANSLFDQRFLTSPLEVHVIFRHFWKRLFSWSRDKFKAGCSLEATLMALSGQQALWTVQTLKSSSFP